jgi:cytochrome c peroxidase
MGMAQGVRRSPDALLYALARFIYSLRPPANPNAVDDRSRAGEKIFAKTGCTQCHTPPFYTNNRLTLAEGFTLGDSLGGQLDVMPLTVGTDPGLALKTRKGTGFYRVPSLRMIRLYNCFLHNGSVGSLEELFAANRLKAEFRSSNWGPLTPAHAVKGHPFGLDLAPADRTALIAFLRTL